MSATMSDLDQQKKVEEKTEETSTTQDVPEEEVKLNPNNDQSHTCELDLNDRDPNRMNDHVKVRFSEIFGEPEKEIYSFDKVWVISFKVFSATKTWCYRITSLILALPLAIVWGLVFACLSFCNNWCCIPTKQCCLIEMLPIKVIFNTCVESFCAPVYRAIGLIFSRFNVTVNKNSTIV